MGRISGSWCVETYHTGVMGRLPFGLWNAFGVRVVWGRDPACAARRRALEFNAFGIGGMGRVQGSWCVKTHPTGLMGRLPIGLWNAFGVRVVRGRGPSVRCATLGFVG
jgi:hypothetical protein